jgi:hypothetical protein
LSALPGPPSRRQCWLPIRPTTSLRFGHSAYGVGVSAGRDRGARCTFGSHRIGGMSWSSAFRSRAARRSGSRRCSAVWRWHGCPCPRSRGATTSRRPIASPTPGKRAVEVRGGTAKFGDLEETVHPKGGGAGAMGFRSEWRMPDCFQGQGWVGPERRGPPASSAEACRGHLLFRQVLVGLPSLRRPANGQNPNVFFYPHPCFFDRCAGEF